MVALASVKAFAVLLGRRLLRHPALVPGSGVLMDQALAGGAIEQAHRVDLLLGGGGVGRRGLQSRPQGRTLSAVTDVGRARLAHVLFRGIDSGHDELSKKLEKSAGLVSNKS